ncbi:MAG: GNAT family N-acetyltransferase [Candidatus Staskawiczbacteria bacterium]|nr:GNAT family N-acetyltransferase [Candidatus Staskawiczbacteria bacterium]
MTLIIRNLNKEDIPEALKIALETKASCNESEARKVMEMSLAPGIHPLNPNYYVLVLEGEIIGISGLFYDYEDPEDVFWMDYFAVKPELQKHGYGTRMLENLVRICKEKKARMLCVFTDNKNALKFYKKNGFKVCGKIKDYYGKGKSRIWLSKVL